MEKIIIESAKGKGALIIEPILDEDGRRTEYFRFSVEMEGLHATVSVYDFEGKGEEDLIQFFDFMQQNWNGWTGKHCWWAFEDEAEMSAIIDKLGQIELSLRLKQYIGPINWGVETKIYIYAAQMEEIKQQIHRTFAN